MFDVTFATLDSGTIYTNVTSGFPPYSYPPVAIDDEYSVEIGGTIDSALDGLPSLLDNDFDPDGDPFIAVGPGGPLGGTLPMHGTLTVADDGSFIYTHDGSLMSDSFTYFAVDEFNGQFNEGTVTINVVPEPCSTMLLLLACLGLIKRSTVKI